MSRKKELTLEEANKKYSALKSLATRDGKLNAAITRRAYFTELDVYKRVMDETKCLDVFGANVEFKHRFEFLYNKMSVNVCPFCGKPYVYFKHSQRMLRICGHHFNYDEDSAKRVNSARADKRAKEIEAILRNVTAMRLRMKCDDFSIALAAISSNRRKNFNFTGVGADFISDLVVKTVKVLPLPDEVNCFADMQLSHRVWLAERKIFTAEDLPKCKYCGKPTYFINAVRGYAGSCVECEKTKWLDTRSGAVKAIIDKALAGSDYDVVEYPRRVNSDVLKIRCRKCGEISSVWVKNGAIGSLEGRKLCKNCEKPIGSNEEQEIFTFVKKFYRGQIVHGEGSKKVIPPKQLDFYFPKLKRAIEFHGLYWHLGEISESAAGDRHVEKTDMCEAKGISLMQLYSDEWHSDKKLCKKYVRSFLNPPPTARYKVQCRLIPYGDAKAFHMRYNLFGSVKSSVNVGVFACNKLIAVVSLVKCKFNPAYQYEIARISYDRDINANTFAKPVMAFIVNELKIKSIVFYDQRRLSDKDIITAMSLLHTNRRPPDFWYYIHGKRVRRCEITEDKASRLIGEMYDFSLSVPQNMKNSGYKCIWDSGVDVYSYVCP